MTDRARYRLADSVCVEPLIGRWAAWPHLLAPATQSLHLLNYQLKALKSYLANPAIHESSCRNPKMLGGAFVDLPVDRASEAQIFLDETEAVFADNIAFAQALTGFHNELVETAKGESLETYYEKLPSPLRGFSELLYDYYNRPILRLLEGPLYKSRYYKREAQSLRLFRQAGDLERPYFMSTPRLPGAGAVDWRVAFDAPQIDELFALDRAPRPLHEIHALLDQPPGAEADVRRLLTEAPSAPRPRWEGPGVRVRYFGHACALVESKDACVLIDPLIGPRPDEETAPRFSFADLPAHIDYAVITHGHHDHFVIETLLRLRGRIGTLVVPKSSGLYYGDMSLKLMAQRLGFRSVQEVDALEEIELCGGRIVAVPFLGEHNDLPSAKSAYLLSLEGKNLLFAADSNCLDADIYRRLVEETGPVDTLFVGMECVGAPLSWVYGPILPTKPLHKHSQDRRSNGCNAQSALALARAVQCRQAFVYAVGREPWVRYLLALTPTEDDVYMTEISRYIELLRRELDVGARLLFGKAEILI